MMSLSLSLSRFQRFHAAPTHGHVPLHGGARCALVRIALATLASMTVTAGAAASASELPTHVPPGTTLVIADDARATELLMKLSGEQDKLAAQVSYASFSSGPLRMEATRSGSAQVGIVGDVPPILAHYAGMNMKIVGVVASTGPSLTIVTAPGSNIRRVTDLKGKRVAINDGTAQHAVVLRALERAGLDARDIVPVRLGVAEFADALRARQADAAVLKQPDRARYLASTTTQGAIELPLEDGTYPGYLFAYVPTEVLADPARAAAIRDFLIHWYRAHQWKNTNKDIWLKEYLISSQRLRAEDAEQVVASQGTTAFPGLTDEVIATQQRTIDLLQKAGAFAGKQLDARDEFDLRFANLTAASKAATDE